MDNIVYRSIDLFNFLPVDTDDVIDDIGFMTKTGKAYIISNPGFGISYTLSRLVGNYAGLDGSDEPGRNDLNINRYWDLWFQMYVGYLNPIDGVLPTDKPHYFKAYASYVFPFGLNVGISAYAYSGTPITTEVTLNGQQGYYPHNRFDYLIFEIHGTCLLLFFKKRLTSIVAFPSENSSLKRGKD